MASIDGVGTILSRTATLKVAGKIDRAHLNISDLTMWQQFDHLFFLNEF